MGDDRQVAGEGLTGDQRIVRADGCSLVGKLGSDYAGQPGVGVVEGQDLEFETLDQREVPPGLQPQ